MDDKRTLLAFALMMILWTGYVVLFPPEQTNEAPPVTAQEKAQQSVDTLNVGEQRPTVPTQPTVLTNVEKRLIKVKTDVMTLTFSSLGGGIQSVELTKFKEELNDNSSPVELLPGFTENQGTFTYGGTGQFDFSPMTAFSIRDSRSEIQLQGDQTFTLSMVAQTPSGLQITKNYVIQGDQYTVNLDTVLQSNNRPVQGTLALNLTQPWDDSIEVSRFNFAGPVVQTAEDKEEVSIEDIPEDKPTFAGDIQWAAFVTKYFIRAVAPTDSQNYAAKITKTDDLVNTQLQTDLISLQTGQNQQLSYALYLGPRDMERLENAGHGFDSSMDFGIFGPLAHPLLVVLKFFYSFIGNYGWAIILLTIIIKLLFWPLTQKSYTSMKAMQKLQPEMAKLREKYSKDKQRLNAEMMAMYKEHRVNPMGGCLPMLIQIPVFIALYRVLLGSVELRHAPFMLWINDLSAADTLFTDLFNLPFILGPLPLIMGFTMFLQQKMTPSTMDPTQAKIFMMMPVVFTFMFLSFPSGLVVYWMVNNILTIVQQALIRRAD